MPACAPFRTRSSRLGLACLSLADLALACLALVAAAGIHAATLYTCIDARGITRYSASPCVQGQPAMAIDRLAPEERASTAGSKRTRPQAAPASGEDSAGQRTLTPAQSARIAQLRAAEEGATREARIATEIEIAGVREGVDEALTAEDRKVLAALRADLAASDASTRERALRAWQALYARHRVTARRPPPAPSTLIAPVRPSGEPHAEGPLGRPAPGTQGPLVIAPPALPPPPAGRPAPVTDPATGQVLAPAGDRMVDPITGTLWQRAGRVYVDPATGRVIPAP